MALNRRAFLNYFFLLESFVPTRDSSANAKNRMISKFGVN